VQPGTSASHHPLEAPTAEILYEAELNITVATDFGVPLDAILSGSQPIPPQGARWDVSFAGPVRGQLDGTVEGVDYLRPRADGRMELDLHGVVTLTDGRTLAWRAEVVATPRPGTPLVDITEMIRFDRAHGDMQWLHGKRISADGVVDLAKGTIRATAYA
jgi:hypothetical protein